MMCSMVTTKAPVSREAIVVARRTSITFSTTALTSGLPGMSTRRKMIPVFSGAGRILKFARAPVCSAIPVIELAAFTVFCISISAESLCSIKFFSYFFHNLLHFGMITSPNGCIFKKIMKKTQKITERC